MHFEYKGDFQADSITKYFRNQIPDSSFGDHFIDPYFPPNNNSLLGLDINGNPIDAEAFNNESKNLINLNAEWKRASEIFSDYELFLDKIEINDINQGSLGNCYFLSAISGLTEFPGLISLIFRTKQKNSRGYYEIVLFIDGEWQIVILDDYFPVSQEKGKLLFSQPNSNELWAILLEKAWAKVNYGYLNTIAGICGEALNALTGFSFDCVNFMDLSSNEIWEKLHKANTDKHIIGTGSINMPGIQKIGLVEQHAYTVLSVVEVQKDGQKYKLVKLRNPWGKVEWKGKWSDDSNMWTDELRKALNVENSDDGIFWMSFEEYIRYFANSNIAHMLYESQNYGHVLDDVDVLKEPLVYSLYVPSESNVGFSVITPQIRFHRDQKNFEKRGITIVIAKIHYDQTIQHLEGKYSYTEVLHHYTKLSEGFYTIWIYCSGVTSPEVGKVAIKFSTSYRFCYLQFKGNDQGFNWIKKVTIDHFKQNKTKNLEDDIYLDNDCSYLTNYGYQAIIIYNNRRKPIEVSLNFLYLNGELLDINGKKYKSNEKIQLQIPPKDGYAIICVINKYYSPPSFYYTKDDYKILDKYHHVQEFDKVNIQEVQSGSTYSYSFGSVYSLSNVYDCHSLEKYSLAQICENNDIEETFLKILSSFENHEKHDKIQNDLTWKKVVNDNSIYIGQTDRSGKFNGIGCLHEKNIFEIYFGYFTNGMRDIRGQIYNRFFNNELNLIYECEFKDNKKSGYGKQFSLGSLRFEGTFENDGMKEGILDVSIGRWKGKFKNSKQHGKGILTFYGSCKGFEFEYEWGDCVEEIPSNEEEAIARGFRIIDS